MMVTRSGAVKVMDFGIARIAEGDDVTQTAAVLGTASYLSPEQAQGRPVDARSDLYSLGIVLYEMLTGVPPFTGDTAVAVAYKHVQETPPVPSSKNPEVSTALDAVVMRAVAKNPANRYQTAGEFREDLERVRRGDPVRATPLLPAGADATQVISRPPTQAMPPVEPEGSGRKVWLGILIGALLLLVLGGGLYLLAQGLLGSSPTTTPTTSPTPTPIPYPSVIGETEQAAREALAGFTNIVVKPRVVADPTDPRIGTVIAQDPQGGGTLLASEQVTIFIAKAPKSLTIPSDLIGKDLSTATAELEALKLQVNVQKQTSDQPPGTVILVSPPGGTTVAVGDTVTLTVAEAPAMVEVPEVRCQSFGAAQKKLEQKGLNPIISDTSVAPNPLCPKGNKVAEQDPAPGEMVPPGTTVTLYPGLEPSPSPT
ncbi:MAG: PASTA domain-containing protein [Actinobacteria bacterium]|nr:PASTA domain-containing protein [Actinomycetota bacterium]